MTISVAEQLHSLLGGVLLGIGAGFCYDGLRCLRYRRKDGAGIILLDLLFWLLVTVALFLWSIRAGRGLVQLSTCAALMCGFLFYFRILSPLFFPILRCLTGSFFAALSFLFAPLLWFWGKCCLAGKKVLFFCKKHFPFLQK